MTPTFPAWVEKRDGRREPFDADKISQGLFASTEALGTPNAFLARELTDGVLHFLLQENDAAAPTTQQIADLIEKVVRELGHPNLALEYGRQRRAAPAPPAKAVRQQGAFAFTAADPPRELAARCLRAYSLQTVFTRDLAAAHEEGLLILGGLETPDRLDAVVVDVPPPDLDHHAWLLGMGQVASAQNRAGRWLVVDGPEWHFAAHGAVWLDSFLSHLEAYDRYAIFNVNLASAPGWAAASSSGPLFQNTDGVVQLDPAKVAAFWTVLLHRNWERLRIDWHVQSKEGPAWDFVNRLLWKDRTLSLLAFACDRGRGSIGLSETLDRNQPAVLLEVGLPMSTFLTKPGIDGNAQKFLAKLPSLVRMAASAGVQKRNFLRRMHPELARQFLLDRARLVLAPRGLDEVVGRLTGAVPVQSKLALDTARQILLVLCEAAHRESRLANLDILVSTACERRAVARSDFSTPGLDAEVHAAGVLQEVAGGHWIELTLPSLDAGAWRGLFETVWQNSSLQRFRLRLPVSAP